MTARTYPNLTIRLMAPFVVENYLPFDLRYMIVDRVTKQEHRSYLKKGERDSLHTLDPSHLLALSLSINDISLKQKEVAIITSTDLQFRDETVILYDKDNRQLNLRLNYNDKRVDEGHLVTIYSPYLLLNKTGLSMSFAVKSLLTSHRSVACQELLTPLVDGQITPMMFSYSNFEPLQSRTQIKIDDSEWSKPLSFEAVGSSFKVDVGKEKLGNPGEIQIGVDIQEGAGKYYMTKVITFSPRFLARNLTGEDMFFQQAGTVAQTLFPANAILPLMHFRNFQDTVRQLCIRLAKTESEWSNPFQMTDLGSVYVKLGRLSSNVEDLIRVDIALDKATLFISFYQQEQRWPVRIENQSLVDVFVRQRKARKQYQISKDESLQYAWDFPSKSHKELVLTVNDKERLIEVSKLGKLVPLKYHSKHGLEDGIMAIELVADGPTIVLKLSPFNQAVSKFRVDDQPQTAGFSLIEDPTKVVQVIQVRLEGIGISVVSKRMREIAYITLKGFVAVFTESDKDRQLSVSLQWIQIDNQMYGCMEPILLYPTVVSNEDKDEEHPIFLATSSQLKDTSKILNVNYRSRGGIFPMVHVAIAGAFTSHR